MLYNELASQASSTTSSISRNNLVSLNRGNKKNRNYDDITKEFKMSKYILFVSLFLLLISIIVEYYYIIKIHKELVIKNELYLFLQDYKINFYMLFCSIMTITCIGNTTNSDNCINFIEEITKRQMYEELFKAPDEIDIYNNSDTINNNEETEFVIDLDFILEYIFLDFSKLLFAQNQILSQNLQNKLQEIIKYLSLLNEEQFIKDNFKNNVSYHKIYQDVEDGQIILSLKNENISFEDFMLLITSRCGILTKNFDDIKNPIYVLNKTGENIFNNVYLKDKLNIYQQNIYLLILDFKSFAANFDLAIEQIGWNSFYLKMKLKNAIYIIWSLNLLFVIIIITFISGYIIMYFVIILNLLKAISNNLNEKLGDTLIKD